QIILSIDFLCLSFFLFGHLISDFFLHNRSNRKFGAFWYDSFLCRNFYSDFTIFIGLTKCRRNFCLFLRFLSFLFLRCCFCLFRLCLYCLILCFCPGSFRRCSLILRILC